MVQETSYDKEVVEIDAEFDRPHFHLWLSPRREHDYREKTASRRLQIVRYWHCVAIAVNAAGLALDRIAGVLDHGLFARFGFVIPAYLLGLFLLGRGPNWLRGAAATVPTIVFVSALGYLSQVSSLPDSDRYIMATGVLLLFTNIAIPLHIANAVFMTLGSICVLFGTAFSMSTPALNDVALFAFIAVVSAIALVIRYRTEWDARQSYLEGLRDEIKSAHLIALTQALSRLAETDPMTGLFNRRHLVKTLQEKWREARERNDWLGILMIDIDKFKDYNDNAGHDEGDRCLNAVAGQLNGEIFKAHQYVARYGGEEFMAVVSHLEPEPLLAEAERIRRAIEEMDLPHPGLGPDGHVTVSIGAAAMIPTPHATIDDLMIAADKALYAAKAAGRNRVMADTITLPRQADGSGSRPVIGPSGGGRSSAARH